MTNKDVAVPEVTVARYAAPRVTVTPVTDVISSEPIAGRSKPGRYQRVLLDTRTGELRFHESTEHLEPWDPAWKAVIDVPRDTWTRWHPGTLFAFNGPHQWFEPVPELLSWGIDSGVAELPFLDVAAANALLEEVVPVAQELLNGLFDGGGDLDWSTASAHAGRNMHRLLTRDRTAAGPEADAELVDFAEILSRFPQVYQPEKLRHPLEKLAEECEWVTRYLGCNEHWHKEIKAEFGKPYSDGSGIGLQVLGVRAWYRTALMDGDPRPLKEFADWDGEHGRLATSEITSTATDAELARWVDREEASAARQGWRLLGTQNAAASHRQRLREQEWDRLAVVGADIAWLEDEPALAGDALEPKQAERLALVTAAIGWGRGDGEIAVRARMPRRTVLMLRESSTGATTGNTHK
ncbi:hypothetical protein ACIPSA_46220 [Streptomyces sp. NPDC086549]|uniref:hypothetical protein n=1 Tax=Streptomyces sp. NPDC086549 TaxID=3365752 RepID=UPI003806B94F